MTSMRTDRVTVGDGAFDLSVWLPDSGSGPGIVLIQEIFGVGSFVRGVGERLAGLGYVVGAPDLYWRFRPGFAAEHDEAGMAESFEAVQQLDRDKAVADCVAALDHLDGLPEVAGRPGVLGYCLGGTLAFAVAAADDPSVCVSYYGSSVPEMTDLLDEVRCPTLLHFGDNDPYIPMDGVDLVAKAIDGRPDVELNIEHAGHAFENSEAPLFYDEAAARSSWAKTTAFLAKHLRAAST